MALDLYDHIHRPAAQGDPRLFLLFHGTGGQAENMLRLADEVAPTAAKLALRGDVLEHGARRYFRRLAEGVYDMEDLARRTEALARFLSSAYAEFDVATDRVIGVGYSNGANFLANLAFEQPDLAPRRMALMHPLIPYDSAAGDLSAHRVLITAGERDPIGPAPLTRALEATLRARGAAVETAWHPGGHEIDPSEIEALARFVS